MIRQWLFVGAIVTTWPGPVAAQPVEIPSAEDEPWPPVMKLTPVRSPDWSDPSIYPAEARRHGQDGTVKVHILVRKDGQPRACRIVETSGYPLLDQGTCRIAMQMRYLPPVNANGENVEATHGILLVWNLPDRGVAFRPNGMTVRLRKADPGQPVEPGTGMRCELSGTGELFELWSERACLVFAQERKYYLGDQALTANAANLLVVMTPSQSAPIWQDSNLGRLVATRRIEFEVDRKGKVRDCRTTIDRGIAALGIDRTYPCGIFLSQTYFEKARRRDPARAGVIEIRAYVADPLTPAEK